MVETPEVRELREKVKDLSTKDTLEDNKEQLDDLDVLDFAPDLKKKKKKKKVDLSAFEQDLEESNALESEKHTLPSNGAEKVLPEEIEMGEESWQKSDRDYFFAELLSRFYKTLREHNPNLIDKQSKFRMVPPAVGREGNKKTIFANIGDIAKRMHRSSEHVIQFLFAELGTNGSVDGNGRLVIKGRFQQKQIESVLRKYITEYVNCKTCKSFDTKVTKENRIYFVTCDSCGSRRSVQGIKTGFQAQVGKRKLLAAKQAS